MAGLLDNIKQQMRTAGVNPRQSGAVDWLVSQIPKFKVSPSALLNNPSKGGRAMIGAMYFFNYDAKYKDTLPVWDKYPLVLPTDLYADGFLGLNLHYLDPGSRVYLLDLLQDFATNDKYNDSTRFEMSYKLLNGSKKYDMIQPCVKRYLFSHIQSSLVYIAPEDWSIACFLPVQRMVYRK